MPLTNSPDDPLSSVVTAISDARSTYEAEYSVLESAVLMVVHEPEPNPFDQRLVEYALARKFRIKCIRRTLDSIDSKAAGPDGPLLM